MAISSMNIKDFGKYLFDLYDNIAASEVIYDGLILEERENGNLKNCIIKFEIKENKSL